VLVLTIEWSYYVHGTNAVIQMQSQFHNLFISVGRSACFRRSFRLSPGARNCVYSVRYLSDQHCYLLLAWPGQFWAPDDGRKDRLKYAERPTEINKLWNVASCWLYSANILAMHGPMNVTFKKVLKKCDKKFFFVLVHSGDPMQ